MAVSIPQVVTEDRASGALVIDGSLKFDQSKSQYLTRTFSAGNRRTWTHSSWVRQGDFGRKKSFFMAGPSSGISAANFLSLDFDDNDKLRYAGGGENYKVTSQVFRDTGWYHVVWTCDTTEAAAVNRTKIYVNGELITDWSTSSSNPSENFELPYNENGVVHRIGTSTPYNNDREWNDSMSQVYFIDGQALGPGYFGYTDPLTGTWRPKKFRAVGTTVNNGTNWSAGLTGTADGSGAIGLMFDGDTTDGSWSNSSGYSVAFPNGSVTATNNIKIYGGSASANWYVVIDGVKTTINAPGGSAPAWSATGVSGYVDLGPGTLTSIGTEGVGIAQNGEVSGIEIDGVIMLDSTTQNLAYGTNGFYLPMDGNSPIGQDQSGNGNNWTPVNFGGSAALDQATGALPILNTLGGTVARPGVFGSEVSKNYTTTSNTAAGSGYEFDQTSGFNPSLSFVRGATYTFDYTDSSSHPLRFSSTDPDSSVTSYTDGTNTSVSNTVKITVPHNAPDTLYYYCTSHNSMNGRISVTTDTKKADPYASSCVFAAPFISNSLDVSDQINCTSSQKANSSADVGVTYNTTVTTTNFYKSYGVYASAGGSQKVVYSDSADFDLDGPFTIEFFIKMNSDTDCTIICDDGINGDPQVKYTSANDRIQLQSSNVNIEIDETYNTATLLRDGNWHHVAFVRSAVNDTNAIYLFIDGVAQTLRARTNSAGSSVNFNQMALFTGALGRFPGYMQDLRIYKGVAKYTSNFIPASTNPDILPDTPSGAGTKTQLTKITDGAVSFDGSNGNGLIVADSTDFDHASAFTWEGYFYLTSYDSSGVSVIRHENDGLDWYINTSGNIIFNQNPSTSLVNTGNGVMVLNKWVHIAVSHTGSVCKIFVDGIEKGSATTSTVPDNVSGNLHIGESGDNESYQWNGFISNLRFVNGTALYTSNFKPPTRKLTNVTNTKLLCCQSNTLAGAADVSPSISGINDGIVWSEEATITPPSSGFSSGGGISQAFDGSTTTLASGAGSRDEFFVIDFSRDITVSTSLEVWMNSGASQFKVNDGSFSSSLNNGAWRSLSFTGTLSKLTVKGDSPQTFGNFAPRLSAIRIDGSVILTDPVTRSGNTVATTFNPFTTDINTIRGQEGAYATLNPLDSATTLSNGNLTITGSGSAFKGVRSNIGMTSGKWYMECVLRDYSSSTSSAPGIWNDSSNTLNTGGGSYGNAYLFVTDYSSNYKIYVNQGGTTAYEESGSLSDGDLIGIALDLDNGKCYVHINGIYLNRGASVYDTWPADTYFFGGYEYSSGNILDFNFGQKPFKFPPPDGFQPLTSSTVRPDTVIPRPDQYVGVKTYSGNEGTQTISGLGMSPDFIWIKCRNDAVGSYLADTVRGINTSLQPNTTDDVVTNHPQGYVSTTTRDGFTLVSGASGSFYVNGDPETYVAWCWKAGGNKGVFNVDDVGYANASDVNMSVGALNSTAYNTSQDWSNSSNTSGSVNTSGNHTPANMFNGILGNENVSGAVCFSVYSSNASMTWTSPVSFTNLTSLRLYVDKSGSNDGFLRVNGTNYDSIVTSSDFTDGWVTIPETYLETIQFGYTGGVNTATGVAGVEVNGQLLIDNGNSPANIPLIPATGSSVGTKQGFSIVKYAGNSTNGSTLAHGLGQIPDFVICKNLGTSYNWFIWHNEFGNGENAAIYFTDASKTTGYGTQPFVSLTEHAITLNGNDGVNGNYNYIMYAWHDVPGLQKFGSFASNNNADGPFIDLGFKPAILWIKSSTYTGGNWLCIDNTRSPNNPADEVLRLNTNADETDNDYIDFTSNGFKVITNQTGVNGSSETTIYCAWAEAPTFNLYGAQSNAR